jgi:hypothetical protein
MLDGGIAPPFLIYILDGGEWSASGPGRRKKLNFIKLMMMMMTHEAESFLKESPSFSNLILSN